MKVEVRRQLFRFLDEDVRPGLLHRLVTWLDGSKPVHSAADMMITKLRFEIPAARALNKGEPTSVHDPHAVMNSRLFIVILQHPFAWEKELRVAGTVVEAVIGLLDLFM